MKILIIGGAGYIGSHMTKMLIKHNHNVTVYDNLSTGHSDSIHPLAKFIQADLSDINKLKSTLKSGFQGVMHFASSIQVGESITKPSLYYNNNLSNSINLLDAMVESKCNNLIFSSSAAVYGNPTQTPISEEHICNPINPYGKTKHMVEQVLHDYNHAYGLNSVSLRYFNAAGASPDGSIGERHNPETHLIPLVLKAALGELDHISIYGDNYNTPDGTCIRDYIHVDDLCSAHLLALQTLTHTNAAKFYNLGNGDGFSVKDIINTAVKVTGIPIHYNILPRRIGDPDILVADSSNARNELGWKPKHSNIHQIISDAWNFELSKANH